MNGVFNSGLDFWQIIIGIIVLTLSIVTIKVAVNFDLNKYLERKDIQLKQRLKNACTHMFMEPAGEENGRAVYKCTSLFESPSGTLQWQCQRCGVIRNHNNDYAERADYFAKNPDKYLEQNKKFQKLLKKSGMA